MVEAPNMGLPDTTEMVEKYLRGITSIADVPRHMKNEVGVLEIVKGQKYLNHLGESDFKFKDLRYHLTLNNLVEKNKGKNQYLCEFVRLRSGAGFVISGATDVVLNKAQAALMRASKRTHFKAQDKEKNGATAVARDISDEEAKAMSAKDDLEKEDKTALAKYNLAEFYGIPAERITEAFVAKYNKPAAKSVFRTLNGITDETFEEGAKRRLLYNAEHNEDAKTVKSIRKDESLWRLVAALDIINILFDDWTRDINCFYLRYLGRADLERRLNQVIALLDGIINYQLFV